jgi:hypothetical protein
VARDLHAIKTIKNSDQQIASGVWETAVNRLRISVEIATNNPTTTAAFRKLSLKSSLFSNATKQSIGIKTASIFINLPARSL